MFLKYPGSAVLFVMKHISLVLFICLFCSCVNDGKALSKTKVGNETDSKKNQKNILGLDNYILRVGPIKIKKVSDNASGLTFNPLTKSLFLVINNPTKILELELDGKVKRVIQLKGFRDTEGIVHIENNLYAVAEEGLFNVVYIKIEKDTKSIDYSKTKKISLEKKIGGNKGLEGLTYDKQKQSFYSIKEKTPRKIYTFKKRKSAKIKTLWDFEKINFDLSDISAIHFHEATKHLLILSHESRALVECTKGGEEISRLSLKAGSAGLSKDMPQAEGVAMDDKGTLYICSEPNLLYIFRKKRLK